MFNEGDVAVATQIYSTYLPSSHTYNTTVFISMNHVIIFIRANGTLTYRMVMTPDDDYR